MKQFLTTVDRGIARTSIIVGAAVAALILAAGFAVALTTPKLWTAESQLVVLPSANLDDAESAAFYETLSRGQLVGTFAEVSSNHHFQQQAADQLKLSAPQQEGLTSEVTVVPDTSVILIRVTATDSVLAERMADAMNAISRQYLAGLSKPYQAQAVSSAEGTAYLSSTSPTTLAAAGVVVALIAGLAVQQALYHLLLAIRTPAAGAKKLSLTRSDAA
ncbi:MAG: hypothetical protein QM650_13750 [Microlunatus sp.]